MALTLKFDILKSFNPCLNQIGFSPILWPHRLVWLLVCCLYKDVYLQFFFKCVSFWLHGCCGGVGRWARKPVNPTSLLAVVTPTDRPKSVRIRCLIELFCGVVCVVTLPFWHFCWCRGFCHRTVSDLLLFVFKPDRVSYSAYVLFLNLFHHICFICLPQTWSCVVCTFEI